MTALPFAASANIQGRNNNIIIQEIAILEIAILDAIATNLFTVTITDVTAVTINATVITGSPMTLSALYYDAWKLLNDNVKIAEMVEVTAYFSALGYAISRRVNATSGTTLEWVISW